MNKLMKFVNVLFIVFLLLGTGIVKSATTGGYDITRIDFDDTTILDDSRNISTEPVVYVERGQTSIVEVWIEGANLGAEDVKVKAWVGGYEFGDIEDTSGIFDVEDGITYKKTLKLDIPEDFSIDEDGTDKLHVEVFDSDNSLERTFEIKIKEKRHAISLIDVILNPGLNVEAGKTLFGTVRVENLGDRTERDIKVVMSIPELGLSTRTFIDRLYTERDINDNSDSENKISASSDELFLKIPEDTKEGAYTLKVQVTYNRGHTTEEKTYALNVKSAGPAIISEESLVSVDSTSQDVQAGKGAVFKVVVTNLGSKTMTYTTDVAGVSSWGSSRIDPAIITVAPDQTGEMFVFVSANENAQTSENAVTLTVKSGTNIVKQFPVTVKISGTGATTDTFSSLRKGLEIGFIVLLIVLVILGLILAARKLGGKEEEEGKTYY